MNPAGADPLPAPTPVPGRSGPCSTCCAAHAVHPAPGKAAGSRKSAASLRKDSGSELLRKDAGRSRMPDPGSSGRVFLREQDRENRIRRKPGRGAGGLSDRLPLRKAGNQTRPSFAEGDFQGKENRSTGRKNQTGEPVSRKEKQTPERQPRQQGERPAVRREGSSHIKGRQIGITTGKESFLSSGTEGKARTARTPSEPCGAGMTCSSLNRHSCRKTVLQSRTGKDIPNPDPFNMENPDRKSEIFRQNGEPSGTGFQRANGFFQAKKRRTFPRPP